MLTTFIQLIFIFLFIRQIVIFLIAWYTGNFSEVPFHATNHFAVHETIRRLKQHAGSKSKLFFELGSGSGRISLAVAKHFPYRVIGVEKNPALYQLANLKTFFTFNKLGTVTWRNQSFFDTNLNKAQIVYMYIIPEIIEQLIPKLETELKSGTLVLSWRFPMQSTQFKRIDSFKRQHHMYIYRRR